jgi:hypothetical protein
MLKKQLSIYCALGKVSDEAGKQFGFDGIFCEVRAKDHNLRQLDPEHHQTCLLPFIRRYGLRFHTN